VGRDGESTFLVGSGKRKLELEGAWREKRRNRTPEGENEKVSHSKEEKFPLTRVTIPRKEKGELITISQRKFVILIDKLD